MRRRKCIAKKTAEWTRLESHPRGKAPFLLNAIGNARIPLLYCIQGPKNKSDCFTPYASVGVITLLGISFRKLESATYSNNIGEPNTSRPRHAAAWMLGLTPFPRTLGEKTAKARCLRTVPICMDTMEYGLISWRVFW